MTTSLVYVSPLRPLGLCLAVSIVLGSPARSRRRTTAASLESRPTSKTVSLAVFRLHQPCNLTLQGGTATSGKLEVCRAANAKRRRSTTSP
ncbi:hypothetical protein AAT19DRAFT_14596 [Rhodotorula toruloides]|uniref:Uncharacterized protein n=1 Tax=Rhodotorula toruloides TaxID=5286 RepID=A0A2T0A8B3_RHOTO|nr:hypothetical protein AAT19DRAFT_14596 [Rhodotorula toruloides]